MKRKPETDLLVKVSYAILSRMKSIFVFCLVSFALRLCPVLSGEGSGRAELEGPDTKALGVFRDSESPSAAFTLRNAGDGPLKITRIVKTCGCAGAEAEKDRLEPGATTAIRVTVAPYTLEGAFAKSVFVLTDAAGRQPLRLTVTGACVPLFSVRPSKSVDTGRLPGGARWEGSFELEASEPAVLGIPAVTSGCPASVSIEALPGTTGDRPRWTIPVNLSPPAHGSFRCQLVIPVLSPSNRPPLMLEVAGRAGTELFAVPSAFSLPLSEDTVVRTVRLRLSGSRNRKLDPGQLNVLPETKGLEVRAEAESGGGLIVRLSVSPGLARHLADNGPLQLTLSVPDAAPASLTLRPAPAD